MDSESFGDSCEAEPTASEYHLAPLAFTDLPDEVLCLICELFGTPTQLSGISRRFYGLCRTIAKGKERHRWCSSRCSQRCRQRRRQKCRWCLWNYISTDDINYIIRAGEPVSPDGHCYSHKRRLKIIALFHYDRLRALATHVPCEAQRATGVPRADLAHAAEEIFCEMVRRLCPPPCGLHEVFSCISTPRLLRLFYDWRGPGNCPARYLIEARYNGLLDERHVIPLFMAAEAARIDSDPPLPEAFSEHVRRLIVKLEKFCDADLERLPRGMCTDTAWMVVPPAKVTLSSAEYPQYVRYAVIAGAHHAGPDGERAPRTRNSLPYNPADGVSAMYRIALAAMSILKYRLYALGASVQYFPRVHYGDRIRILTCSYGTTKIIEQRKEKLNLDTLADLPVFAG